MSLILTEFCASWCVPSQAMKPLLYKLIKEYRGKVLINFVNVDMAKTATATYQLTGCPTFILFRDGVEVERRVGAQSESQLREMMDKWL